MRKLCLVFLFIFLFCGALLLGSCTDTTGTEEIFILNENENGCTLAGIKDRTVESITIPDNVTAIGDFAFMECSRLTKIVIPDTVTYIGNNAFEYCASLVKVDLGNGVTHIGKFAFSNCEKLVQISGGANVTDIGGYAFAYCTSLASITIGEKITNIGGCAFSYCENFLEIVIPSEEGWVENFADIDELYGFHSQFNTGESRIKEADGFLLYSHDGINYLVGYTGNDAVLVLPENCNGENYKVYKRAFINYEKLISITIPEAVTAIEGDAFKGCGKLIEVVNHSSLRINGRDTRNGYVRMYMESLHSEESKIIEQNGFLFLDSARNLYLTGYVGDATELVLPDSYNGKKYRISRMAFAYNNNITSVTLSNGISGIDENAFYCCKSLKNIIFSNQMTKIPSGMFSGCSSLTSITVPDGITSIGDHAFLDCNGLTVVVLPSTLRKIEEDAFYSCNKLVEVINHSNLKISKGDKQNGEVGFYAKEIHSGKSKVANKNGYLFYSYDGTNYLLGYAGDKTRLSLPFRYGFEKYEIYNLAFFDCDTLVSVDISSGVTAIGKYAFKGCDALSEVDIANSVTSISDAFTECHALKKITLSERLTEITQYAFYKCTALKSIKIPKGVTEISDNSFQYCSSLKEVFIPDSVTNIDRFAFKGCSELLNVTVPGSVKTVRAYAFEDCRALKSVTFKSGVESISIDAFYKCTALENLYIPASMKNIDARAFGDCPALASAVFEDPSGWKKMKGEDSTATDIAENELSDPAAAAERLRDKYSLYYLKNE